MESRFRTELKDKDTQVFELQSQLDVHLDIVSKLKLDLDNKNKEVLSSKDSFNNISKDY